MEAASQYILSSLDHALDVLGLFFEREELTAASASKELGVSRTAAFRMLYTLEAKGYLTRTAEGAYRLGVKLFSLGQLAQSRMVLAGLVRPYLSRLSDETGETAHLAIMDGPFHVVFVDKSLGRLNLKMDTVLGDRRWAHQTATGKAMLSFKPRELLEQYTRTAPLGQHTPNSISTPEWLYEELARTRERGWAIDDEESEDGLKCFAVPLIDGLGSAIAAISCSGPSTRMEHNRARILASLQKAAADIARAGKIR